jgi:hypothetical protein
VEVVEAREAKSPVKELSFLSIPELHRLGVKSIDCVSEIHV